MATPEQLAALEIIIETDKRIASARLVLAEAEEYKELILSYLDQVKVDMEENHTRLQAFIDSNR